MLAGLGFGTAKSRRNTITKVRPLRGLGVRWFRAQRSVSTSVKQNVLPSIRKSPPAVAFERIQFIPPSLLAADSVFFSEVLSGAVPLAGSSVALSGLSAFAVENVPPAWRDALNGFNWLTHLRATGEPAATALALEWVDAWVASTKPDEAWQPSVASERLLQWLSHADWLLSAADARQVLAMSKSVAETLSRMEHGLKRMPSGHERCRMLIALTIANLALPDRDENRVRSEALLVDALLNHIDEQGVSRDRNASHMLVLLQMLIPLQEAYATRAVDMPPLLASRILQLPEAIRHLRLPNGQLARFNGASPNNAGFVAALLAHKPAQREHVPTPEFTSVRVLGGYGRLSANVMHLLMDCGATAPSQRGASGPLSIVLSIGQELVVTNCGTCAFGTRVVKADTVGHSTASHSTLCLGHESAAPVKPRARLDRATTPAIDTAPAAGSTDWPACDWQLHFEHDGYVALNGLAVARSVHVNSAGDVLHGRDSVREVMSARRRSKRDASMRIPYAIHFHLAPSIAVEQRDRNSATLLLPSGPTLQFMTDGEAVSVEWSELHGTAMGTMATRQLVVRGRIAHGDAIRWCFRLVA